MSDARAPTTPIKGRGSSSWVKGRFETTETIGEDDGWGSVYEDLESHGKLLTSVTEEVARSIVSRNDSPDIGFSQSVNPFRGCEHGCVYCFARPTHAYLNLSPGLDFESKLFAKTNAAELLRKELSKKSYKCTPIALGINTDAYQPIERRLGITRSCLEVLSEFKHPVTILTKSASVERDIDLLVQLSEHKLVAVGFSITTLDNRLASRLEPRASAPHSKLRAMRRLSDAGVPVGVSVAPIIPMITDSEIERILEASREHGAEFASYVLLRLPHELSSIWREWLDLHYPQRSAHVMSLVQQMRGGKDYESGWGTRMSGTGVFAKLVATRFRAAHRRLGYSGYPALRLDAFSPPKERPLQGELW